MNLWKQLTTKTERKFYNIFVLFKIKYSFFLADAESHRRKMWHDVTKWDEKIEEKEGESK